MKVTIEGKLLSTYVKPPFKDKETGEVITVNGGVKFGRNS